MIIREFKSTDKTEVLELLKRNTPDFFDPAEEKDLDHYLDNEVEDYFVVEQNSKIIGAGGINYFPEEKAARISWDIIDPESQGRGVGRALMEHRVNMLENNPMVTCVIVRTSQLVYRFYEKMGFALVNVEKDYWAANYDLYQMEYTG
ncbi:MAG: GNAT family N-acetyltransferase [Rufibacter sp.]